MRKRVLFISFLFSLGVLSAQRLVLPSQLQFNQLNYNPAFAGVKEGLNFSSTNRRQLGKEFSLNYHGFSIDLPLRFYSMGLGLSVEQNSIEENKETTLKLAYSYKIKLAGGVLNFGLDAGFDQFSYDLNNQSIRDLDDPTLFNNDQLTIPTIGAGLFFQKEKLFVGISTDQLIKRSLPFDSPSSEAKTSANYFLVAGTNHKLSDKIVLTPRIFIQKTAKIKTTVATNLQLIYQNKLWVGMGYRLSSELISLVGADFSQLIQGVALPLKIGLAYNNPLNQEFSVRSSWEIHLTYNYRKRPNADKIREKKRIISPITFY